MSLSLLAPLALMGALLVAVPIILHLIDRRRVPRIDFPALRFLLAAQKRLKRRRRIRDPLLLAIRILVLAAAVLAFSGPMVKYRSTTRAGAQLSGNVVFLLDNSMSMGYRVGDRSLFEQARIRAGEVLDRMAGQGRAGLIVFNKRAEDMVGGVTQDLSKVRDALEGVSLSYEETDLKIAILAGLRALLATPEGSGDLYLLSDQCRHGLPAEAELTLPPQLEGKVRLVVSVLDEGARPNRALMGVSAEREGGEGGVVKISAQVRGQGEGLNGDVPLDFLLGQEVVSRGFVTVGPDETVEKVFTLPSQTDPSGEGALRLGDDALEADNQFYFKLSSRRELKALVIDGDPGDNLADAESYFVERALNPRKSSGSRISPMVVGEGAVHTIDASEFAVVFMLNVADPGPLAPRLEPFVKNGGGLFIALGDRVRRELYNRYLSSLLPASIGDVKASSPELTGETPPALSYPEMGHPIFQVFREAGAPVFSTVAFYKLVPTAPILKPGGEVLLKYSHGLPALLGRTVGAGRVLLFTSSLDRAWTNFPLKSIFLPFIQESAHYLAKNPTGEEFFSRFTVGQPVVLEVPSSIGALSVIDPSDKVHELEAPVRSRDEQDVVSQIRIVFRETSIPGHYRVMELREGEDQPSFRSDLSFVANVSTREEDLTLMTVTELEDRISGLPVVVEGQTQTAGKVEVDRTIQFSYSLLWALLALLGVEGALVALRRHRREALVGEGGVGGEAPAAGEGALGGEDAIGSVGALEGEGTPGGKGDVGSKAFAGEGALGGGGSDGKSGSRKDELSKVTDPASEAANPDMSHDDMGRAGQGDEE